MSSRLAWYAGISTALAGGVVLSAFNQRANFYSACVYLAQSNLCLMILINLILFIFSSFMYGLQRLCYGPLRPIEIEQLYEKAWFAITETCLAMTIFREEVGAWFLVISSTACRYIISVVESRVVKKQTQERLIERKREVREERAEIIRQREIARAEAGDDYQEPTTPLPSEDDVEEMDIEVPGWEAKGQWVLTLDLITDFMKLSIYSSFFFILFTFYGLPIHIMRDLFVTARSFVKRLTAFLRYRRATHDMNARYEDATVEDIQREDTCIICREEMRPWSVTNPPVPAGAQPRPGTVNERTRPKKLPCGHILHLGCLKSWLERQQVCPTCRNPVVETPQDAQANTNRNARANQPAPGQQDGPAGAQPPAAPGRGRGMRMLNLGPIRLGFGQANLNDFPGLQNPPGGQAFLAELSLRSNQFLVHNGDHAGPIPLDQLPQHLEEIEQQVVQEIRNLQLSQQQLLVVQLLQGELSRLRSLQNNATDSMAATLPLPQPPQVPNFHQTPQIPPSFSSRPTSQPQIQRHSVRPNTSAIPSGSADLPPGVVIPEASTSTQNVVSPINPENETSNNRTTPINTEQNHSQAGSVDSSETNVINTPPSISADQSASTIHTLPSSTNTNPFANPPDLPNWGNSQLFSGSSLAVQRSTMSEDQTMER
ncbi:hypothetical protein DID88_003812 [Monilinia fructigena]|uniref:RING-type E3 ubiquitin transferase n=1 Tax=Monilinia fructigena TaxID=38457 RepID=A0A395IUQ1_9HELO|nr:hypothetical protein DID88_003812 [Monilinia fructigena]